MRAAAGGVAALEEVAEAQPDVSGVLRALAGPKEVDVTALRELLQRAAQRIFEEERRAAAMPGRSELREKLEAIVSTANKLAKLVADPAVINAEPEIHEAFGGPEGLDVPMALVRLRRFAEAGMQRIPEGPGRTTTAPAYGRFGGQLLCACIIAEVWRCLYRRTPDSKTPRAQEACAALWQAAGERQSERVESGEVDEGAAWQRHLANVCRVAEPRALTRRSRLVKKGELQLVNYQTPECQANFLLDPSNKTVWAAEQQIAALFGTDRNVVAKHLKYFHEDKRSDRERTCVNIALVRQEGHLKYFYDDKGVEHYSLDAILSVGYRVSPKRAKPFRQFANRTLNKAPDPQAVLEQVQQIVAEIFSTGTKLTKDS